MYTGNEDSLSARIRALGPVEPPPRLSARVLEAMANAADAPDAGVISAAAGRRPYDRTAAVAGLAAAASIAALFVVMAMPRSDPPASLTTARVVDAGERPTSATRSTVPAAAGPVVPLIEASWLLEHAIDALPGPRRLMRADTASTIAALETRIAAIDAELGVGGGQGSDQDTREALWRDRVNAMTALYQVRYAQSRTFGF